MSVDATSPEPHPESHRDTRARRGVGAALAAVLAVLLCTALPAAEDEPIDIEADDGWFDLKEGRYHYEGDVVVTRGRMVIEADVAEIVTEEGEIRHVLTRGAPATFHQEKADGSGTIRGRARDMRYEADSDLVRLTGEAWVQQGSDELSGPLIVYNTETERAQVGSRDQAEGEDGGEDGRVRITITPRRDGDGASGQETPPAEDGDGDATGEEPPAEDDGTR